jgi:hypothetical protein
MVNPDNGPVVNLEHNLVKLFVLIESTEAPESQEVIVNGTIWYELKNGTRVEADWASWAVLTDQGDGELKISYHKFYVDPSGLSTAIAKMMNEQKQTGLS